MQAGGDRVERHTITEILTAHELAVEGRAMRHCVYSYAGPVERGDCSIWSYRVDGERKLTIEVINRTRRVAQCRGQANRMAKRRQRAVVERWMQLNGFGGTTAG